MKKVLLLTAAIALFAVPAMAGIKTSRHNLGTTGDYDYRQTTGVTQICMFCHTPHNPAQPIPLWNRTNPTGAWKTYSSPTINGANVKGSLAADSISMFCLSCHDGATGLYARIQNKRESEGTWNAGAGAITSDRTNIGGSTGGTVDLSNDHPVNVRLSIARTNDTVNWATTDADVTDNGLRLFRSIGTGTQGSGSDYVECASCHDPHKTVYGKFLRKSNASSSLCLTCHKK